MIRTVEIIRKLTLPIISSTFGRVYWATRFTWLGNGVRIDNPWKVKLGRSVFIDKGTIIEARVGNVAIGDKVYIGCYSVIMGNGIVNIGSNVLIGAHCVITSSNHKYELCDKIIWEQGMLKEKVSIGDDVWLGANVKVMPGVSVGSGAVVGAGSVITEDIPSYAVVVGVPGRVIKFRKDETLTPQYNRGDSKLYIGNGRSVSVR